MNEQDEPLSRGGASETAPGGAAVPDSARPPAPRRRWLDAAAALTLAAVAALACWAGSGRLDPLIISSETRHVWFDGDHPSVAHDMTHRRGDQVRVWLHPLFYLVTYPATRLLRFIPGVQGYAAIRLLMAGVAAAWISAFFLLLRLWDCRRLDAALFSAVGAVSAASLFSFPVPEVHPLGSLSILIALGVAALGKRRAVSWPAHAAAGVLSLGFTATNWMAGFLATSLNLPGRRALRVFAFSLAVVLVSWVLQRSLFVRHVPFLFPMDGKSPPLSLAAPESLGVLRSFFFHGMILPEIREEDRYQRPEWPVMVTQGSLPGSGTAWGKVGIGLWVALLGLGAWGLFARKDNGRLNVLLVLTAAGQLSLHLLWGRETFLHSCHFTPLLVILAALGTLTPARRASLFLAGALAVCAVVNNLTMFRKAEDFLQEHGKQRDLVSSAVKRRPLDPWPRGAGHAILSIPGSREVHKAYHEPGGSFSPAPGTFGVSLWITGPDGAIIHTSDDLPLDGIRQAFAWPERGGLPAISTEAPDYRMTWSIDGPGRSRLRLEVFAAAGRKAALVLRSVGPAGGPVNLLQWDGARLCVNGRWSLKLEPAPASVHLGEEGPPGWIAAKAPAVRHESEKGWGHARLELPSRGQWDLTIEGPAPGEKADLAIGAARAAVRLDVPEERFAPCLDSQVAHLLMSIVGRETRSSDPFNVPVPWQRTGAYIIASLAAAGRLEAARELSAYLAENDFYGGYGAEADAPGLGIWALEEVASRLCDPIFDETIWPHVHRKADFILSMLSATEPLRRAPTVPFVPRFTSYTAMDLIADPPQDGLIVGRMDFHRPILYVNAVSFRGLLDAAALAGRMGRPADAERWRSRALELGRAWERAFRPPASENERTYISGLWPSWVAAGIEPSFQEGLEARWSKRREADGGYRAPVLWTYFEAADAHQWLFLRRPERTWATLRWLWDHQASPGLYTWWEGDDEGNTYGGWEDVRGWVAPPSSQPHYWTSAEMILLQLDMLAYVDLRGEEPALVIGAGVPAEWLERRVSVQGLSTRLGLVDWRWDGGTVSVLVKGRKCPVRLGPAFGPDARLSALFQLSP